MKEKIPSRNETILDKVHDEIKRNPQVDPHVHLARQISAFAVEKIMGMDARLAERLGGFKNEYLYPSTGSRLYAALDDSKNEVNFFEDLFGSIWLSTVIEAYFDAKQTKCFDYKMLGYLYSEKIQGTCLIPFPNTSDAFNKSFPLDVNLLDAMFEENPSGAIFLTDQGLSLNPPLQPLLQEAGALHPIRRWPLRDYRNLSRILTKTPEVFQGINVDSAWNWWQTQLSGKTPNS